MPRWGGAPGPEGERQPSPHIVHTSSGAATTLKRLTLHKKRAACRLILDRLQKATRISVNRTLNVRPEAHPPANLKHPPPPPLRYHLKILTRARRPPSGHLRARGISARADQRSLERRITHAGSSEIEIEPLPVGNGIEIEISPSGITHNPKTQSITVYL